MKLPLTTPCAHNFCKSCLLDSFDGLSAVRERTGGGRTLRTQKIIRKCPFCPNDISDFLQNPQVNREMMDLIESLQRKEEQESFECLSEEGSDHGEKTSNGQLTDHVEKGKAAINGNGEKKVEAVDGDSEVNAAESEDDFENIASHRKRKRPTCSGAKSKKLIQK
uniref:E3 ubiquitin-protein ligase ORTHRUS 2 n=2 Tax=Anthurium amnicola TaxID=1678845 RepID=A0A1D1XD98_9ARAE